MTEISTAFANNTGSESSTGNFQGIGAPTFSAFRFKTIGQIPALLTRFTAPDPSFTYRSPSPESSSNMDVESSEDINMLQTTVIPNTRKSLFETLAGNGQDQGVGPSAIGTKHSMDAPEDSGRSAQPFSKSCSHASGRTTPPCRSPLRPDVSPSDSIHVGRILDPMQAAFPSLPSASSTYVSATNNRQDEYPDDDEMLAYPPSSPSPISIINHLSDLVHQQADLDKLRDLRKQFADEIEEFYRRSDETSRAIERSKQQAERVISIAEDAFAKTETLIVKHEQQLENDKTEAEAKISARKAAEKRDRLRRQAQEIENQQRLHDEERRKALEEESHRREKEEARVLQEEERRLKEEEEKRKIQEIGDRLRREDEERRRLEEEEEHRRQKERLLAEEAAKREQQKKEAMTRKLEEETRAAKLEEREMKVEEERLERERAQSKVAGDAKEEVKSKVEEELRRKLYLEKKAATLTAKWNVASNSEATLKGHTLSKLSIERNSLDSSACLFPSPPASSSSSEVHRSPDPLSHLTDAKTGNGAHATAKEQLKTAFVPAATEAGKLVLPDASFSISNVSDTRGRLDAPYPRAPQSNVESMKLKNKALSVKQEPQSPIVPEAPLKQTCPETNHGTPMIQNPSTTVPLPTIPILPTPARIPPSGPSRNAPSNPRPASLKSQSSTLPRHPGPATKEPFLSVRRKPSSPLQSHPPTSPRQRGRSSTPRRSPSPILKNRSVGGRIYDHYSPNRENWEHWSPEHRSRVDFPRRDCSPPTRKRPRDDSWVPSDENRQGMPAKKRAVRDQSPAYLYHHIPPRSPPSPRQSYPRRPSALADRMTAQASSSGATETFDTVRRKIASAPAKHANANLPPRPKSTVLQNPPDTLLERMSDNRSPQGPRVAKRKSHVPLEYRLTSGSGAGMPLGERLS